MLERIIAKLGGKTDYSSLHALAQSFCELIVELGLEA